MIILVTIFHFPKAVVKVVLQGLFQVTREAFMVACKGILDFSKGLQFLLFVSSKV